MKTLGSMKGRSKRVEHHGIQKARPRRAAVQSQAKFKASCELRRRPKCTRPATDQGPSSGSLERGREGISGLHHNLMATGPTTRFQAFATTCTRALLNRLPKMPQMALHSSLFARISAKTQDLLQKNTRPVEKELSELLTPQQLAACPREFLCPISLDIMRDPVLLLPTGQIYDFHSLTQWFESGGRSCPLTGMPLEGTVRMRYDPERRANIMAWLAEQGVDVTAIPQLAKPTPTPQASEGDAGGGGCRQASRQGWDKFLRGLIAFGKFVGGTSKIYGNIY